MALRTDNPRLRAIDGTAAAAALLTCSVRLFRHRDWTALLVRGELDLAGVDGVAEATTAALAERKPLVIELAGLDFVDLTGVRALKKAVSQGATSVPPVAVELHGARGQVADLIRRVGLEHLLDARGALPRGLTETPRWPRSAA